MCGASKQQHDTLFVCAVIHFSQQQQWPQTTWAQMTLSLFGPMVSFLLYIVMFTNFISMFLGWNSLVTTCANTYKPHPPALPPPHWNGMWGVLISQEDGEGHQETPAGGCLPGKPPQQHPPPCHITANPLHLRCDTPSLAPNARWRGLYYVSSTTTQPASHCSQGEMEVLTKRNDTPTWQQWCGTTTTSPTPTTMTTTTWHCCHITNTHCQPQ